MNTLTTNITLPKVDIDSLIWNLCLCILLSCILCWHFNFRSKNRFLRRDLGLVLPVICLTTLLVISVVKSSLALSLGLVGALSIVRFRTPIKEPEELAYIFLAIAIGLALGADQKVVAMIALPTILFVISIIDWLRPALPRNNDNLLISIEVDPESTSSESIFHLIQTVSPDVNIKRLDQDKNIMAVHAQIKMHDPNLLNKLSNDFRKQYPNGKLSVIDDSSIPNE